MTKGNVEFSSNSLSRVRLLIVEDEYILASNLQESLETFGYTVLDIVDSGKAAIQAAIALRPNIILMDIRIRGELDGIQTAEQIWHELQIPIIYVTGHSDQSTVERATLTFPFGYVLKPIREKELYVAIQTALSRYEREQFFYTILQGMGDGVIVVDPKLHIKYLNSAAETLTGWRLDDAKEKLVTETISFLSEPNQHPYKNPILSVFENQKTVYIGDGVFLRCKNGSVLPIVDSAALLKNNEGVVTGAVMVFRDDTQRRLSIERDLANERAQQVELQLAEQQRLNQLKDDFLATTSHELRTPLSNIKLAVSLLETFLNQPGVLNPENISQSQQINRYLSILREQCDQELSLVNDLLDLRSLEAGVLSLTLTTIHLQEWLPHIAESFHERAIAHQQTLQIHISPDLPPFQSDLPSLTRIVSELLNNACKYTPAEGVIELSAALVSDAATPMLQIIVRNLGAEIALEQQTQIFEPFYRIPNNDPWKYGGTGLGLALVKRFIAHLQGTIRVSTAEGWTIFTVQLPLSIEL